MNRSSPCDAYATTPLKQDQNLGEHRFTRNAPSNQLLVKEHQVNSSAQANAILSTLSKRKGIVHPNLMALQDFSSREESGFCSTFFRFKSYYEWYDINLLKFRELAKDPAHEYSEAIMTKFLYDMVAVMSFLQKENLTHGDIRPELIFANRKEGEKRLTFKLLDRVNDLGSAVNTQMNNVIISNTLYLSPKMYESLSNGKSKDINLLAFKNDVFSLGLVILELGLLVSIQSVYEKDRNRFSLFTLQKLMERFTQKYTPHSLLCQSLALMLEVEEQVRPDFVMLERRLPDYKEVEMFYEREGGNPNTQMSRANRVPAGAQPGEGQQAERPVLSSNPEVKTPPQNMDMLSPPQASHSRSGMAPPGQAQRTRESSAATDPNQRANQQPGLPIHPSNKPSTTSDAVLNASKSVPFVNPSNTSQGQAFMPPNGQPSNHRSKLFGEVTSTIPSTDILEDHSVPRRTPPNPPLVQNPETGAQNPHSLPSTQLNMYLRDQTHTRLHDTTSMNSLAVENFGANMIRRDEGESFMNQQPLPPLVKPVTPIRHDGFNTGSEDFKFFGQSPSEALLYNVLSQPANSTPSPVANRRNLQPTPAIPSQSPQFGADNFMYKEDYEDTQVNPPRAPLLDYRTSPPPAGPGQSDPQKKTRDKILDLIGKDNRASPSDYGRDEPLGYQLPPRSEERGGTFGVPNQQPLQPPSTYEAPSYGAQNNPQGQASFTLQPDFNPYRRSPSPQPPSSQAQQTGSQWSQVTPNHIPPHVQSFPLSNNGQTYQPAGSRPQQSIPPFQPLSGGQHQQALSSPLMQQLPRTAPPTSAHQPANTQPLPAYLQQMAVGNTPVGTYQPTQNQTGYQPTSNHQPGVTGSPPPAFQGGIPNPYIRAGVQTGPQGQNGDTRYVLEQTYF